MFGRATITMGIGPHSSLLFCDNVNVLPPLANSDHSVVYCSLCISLPTSSAADSNYASYIITPRSTGLDCVIICHQLIEFRCCTLVLSLSTGTLLCKLSSWVLTSLYLNTYVLDQQPMSSYILDMYVLSACLFDKNNSYWKLYKRFRTDALHDKD